VAPNKLSRPLYEVFLERVIQIDAVQRHREAVADSDHAAQFFDAGSRPGLFGDFKWSLDAPAADDWGPLAPSTGERSASMSPAMQQAWDAAVAAWRQFIAELARGELRATGVHPVTGVRCDLDPAEWTRTGLVLDVHNGDLIEGLYGRPQGRHTIRWLSIVLLRPAEQQPGRIDWDDWWNYEIDRRGKGLLPNKMDCLIEAESLIKKRYGVTTVPESELRRLKAALYRGDTERPKRKPRPSEG
jgi:hypothetical protein